MIYSMDSGSVTLASANATKSALGTVKLVNGFWNPPSSGVIAVIRRVAIGNVSGTPGGPFFWNYIPLAAANPVNSTATGTIQSSLLNAVTDPRSLMTPQTGVTVTTVGSLTTNLTQHSVVGGEAAIASGAGIYTLIVDYPEINGSRFLMIPPSTLFGLVCLAAGTTNVVQTTVWWEEFPA